MNLVKHKKQAVSPLSMFGLDHPVSKDYTDRHNLTNYSKEKQSMEWPPYQPEDKGKKRPLGRLKGQIHIPDDFLDEDEEINTLFYDDPNDSDCENKTDHAWQLSYHAAELEDLLWTLSHLKTYPKHTGPGKPRSRPWKM
jgi:hypothetical protein